MIRCLKFHRKFRQCFRLPYDKFLELVAQAREEIWFSRWCCWNATSPLELLLLGSLPFDDLEEATAISFEVHCNFFHQFICVGSSILYPTFVVVPQAAEEAQTHMVDFSKAGCHGCVGSSDATHIAVEKCSYRLQQNHLGGKTKSTTRTFNFTVNHHHHIISTTPGYPGRWNDLL